LRERVNNYELTITNYELTITNYELRIKNYELRILSMEKDIKNNEIIIYEGEEGQPRIEVAFQGDTVWLTQAQLVNLFQSSKANISEHIKHIFEEQELNRDSVVRKFRTTAIDGKNYEIEHYNLDLIISLGYRVKSQIATKFRIWATAHLTAKNSNEKSEIKTL